MLTAVDPMQFLMSTMARPYSLGCLACILSLLVLRSLLHAPQPWKAFLAAVAYGLTMAFIGYMNPLLLLVCLVHVVMAGFWLLALVRRRKATAWTGAIVNGLCGLGGCLLAGLLLSPQNDYRRALGHFYHQHQDYLITLGAPVLGRIIRHNERILAFLLLLFGPGLVLALSKRKKPPADKFRTEGGSPAALAKRRELLGLAWSCLLGPQIVAVLFYYLAGQSMFLSRYLCYTSIGGIILLAHYWSRVRSPRLRVGLMVLVVLLTLSPRFATFGKGDGLVTGSPNGGRERLVSYLDRVDQVGLWKEGDVVLFPSGFLEGDLLPDEIAAKSQEHIKRLGVAQLMTLYVCQHAKPLIMLSHSQYHGSSLQVHFGEKYRQRDRFYGPELARQLRHHQRFWFGDPGGNPAKFLACLLPWVANALGSDLRVSLIQPGAVVGVAVPCGADPEDLARELGNRLDRARNALILIERKSRTAPG
jgi:hypothetical protein